MRIFRRQCHAVRPLAHFAVSIRLIERFEPHRYVFAPIPLAATSLSSFARENIGTAIGLPFFPRPGRTARQKANPPVPVLPRNSRSRAESPPPPIANTAGRPPQKIPTPFHFPPRTLAPAPNPPNAMCSEILLAVRASIPSDSSAFEPPAPAHSKTLQPSAPTARPVPARRAAAPVLRTRAMPRLVSPVRRRFRAVSLFHPWRGQAPISSRPAS